MKAGQVLARLANIKRLQVALKASALADEDEETKRNIIEAIKRLAADWKE